MRIGSVGPWLLVIVVAAGLGVAIAGVPSNSDEEPLRIGATTTTATGETTLPSVVEGTTTTAGPEAPPFPGTIEVGDSGPAVTQWQQRMADRGWDIDVDGEFGSGTREICQRFQRQKGLEVNGTVDEATWDATWSAPLPDDVD
jgi:peptidoglycan hydrolase-like protein with peptidoglycan-binding domain